MGFRKACFALTKRDLPTSKTQGRGAGSGVGWIGRHDGGDEEGYWTRDGGEVYVENNILHTKSMPLEAGAVKVGFQGLSDAWNGGHAWGVVGCFPLRKKAFRVSGGNGPGR